MRPARTTKKTNPVSSSKGATTASSQGRRDAGAVVSKLLDGYRAGMLARSLTRPFFKSISLRVNEPLHASAPSRCKPACYISYCLLTKPQNWQNKGAFGFPKSID